MQNKPVPTDLAPAPLLGPTPSLAQRLRRLALGVQGLVAVGAVLLFAVLVWRMVAPAEALITDEWLAGAPVRSLLIGDFSSAVRWRMVAASLWPMSLAWAVLWQLWALFGHYRLGAVFAAPAVRHLRRLGWLMLAYALSQPLAGAAMTVAVSLDNPVGTRQVQLSFGSDDYAGLLMALVFMAIAKVMAEAARVAAENEQFV
ncbi:MAG TPA: DUF2975 domain-containing protein [Ideonella sp.]|uniref:DUF2975 domain-containing protein n=1 Tax=Ideonella sp. TaxID=1929293 RepID=UPI002D00E029|nr:DUF2975 domain-containing protein [Ideonella sp.]HSI47031.1 DUF2975 domain-containing protein [Ideonella sp.]